MRLEKKDLNTLAAIAIQAAEEAGALIDKYTRKTFKVMNKETGGSPVSQALTEVDLLSQEIILKHLTPTLAPYDLGLLTEEQEDDGSRFEKDYFWCIDPIDGTLCFIEKRNGFAVSIALVSRAGQAVLGVVFDPVTQTLYHAVQGGGAFRGREPWQMTPSAVKSFETIQSGGSVMNGIWVLEKAPACFYKKPKSEDGGGCLWDYAATACIYQEIGAWMGDMSGRPVNLNSKESLHMNKHGILLASDASVADAVFNA